MGRPTYMNPGPVIKIFELLLAIVLLVMFPTLQECCPLRYSLATMLVYMAFGSTAIITLVYHMNLLCFEKWNYNTESIFVLLLFILNLIATILLFMLMCCIHSATLLKFLSATLTALFLVEIFLMCTYDAYYDYCTPC